MIRQARGLSAQEVAVAAGMSREVLANLESRRRRRITLDEAAALARALEVDLREVITDAPFSVHSGTVTV